MEHFVIDLHKQLLGEVLGPHSPYLAAGPLLRPTVDPIKAPRHFSGS
jgi:hypothetical protein